MVRCAIMTPEQAWQLALGWFQHKVSPDWRRHTVEETAALLGEIGLTGPFWNVRG